MAGVDRRGSWVSVAHQLLQGCWRYASHCQLKPKVMAQTMDERVVWQVSRRCMRQALDEVIQRIGGEVTAVVAHKERVSLRGGHASLGTLGQVLLDAFDGVACQWHLSGSARLGPALDVKHWSVSAANVADSQCDALAIAGAGCGQKVDDGLVSCWPRRTRLLGRVGCDFDHGSDVVRSKRSDGLFATATNLEYLVVEWVRVDQAFGRKPSTEAANRRQLAL